MKFRAARRVFFDFAMTLGLGAVIAPAAHAGWVAVPRPGPEADQINDGCHRVIVRKPGGSVAVHWVCR